MTARLTSRNGALLLAGLIITITSLVILSSIAARGLSMPTTAASLLAISFAVFTLGGTLYAGRVMWKWQIKNTDSYLVWERSFVIVGILATALGLALLEEVLHTAGETVFSRLGLVAYLFGAVVVVVAETAFLSKREWNYAQPVLYVIVAFLGQAAIGVSLLQTGLVPAWVGWVTILWNLGWLAFMTIIRPQDIYFPVLHHVAPLLIGIVLLLQR